MEKCYKNSYLFIGNQNIILDRDYVVNIDFIEYKFYEEFQ